jgi:hypothetical protein
MALAGSGRCVFPWLGELTGMPNDDAPYMLDSSDTFRAEVEIPDGGAEGMIVTQGGRQWPGSKSGISGAACRQKSFAMGQRRSSPTRHEEVAT